MGPVLFGIWYRPPAYGEILSIISLTKELADNGFQKMGTILCGDFNVHHQGWLSPSNRTTPEGKCLFDICCTHQFRECTKVPTRKKHLLDLTLTNVEECVTCKVVGGVSDHQMVVCKMDLPLFSDSGVYRECYYYNKANWSKLNYLFENTDWLSMFISADVATMVQRFTDYVLRVSKQCIPFEKAFNGFKRASKSQALRAKLK